MPFVLAPNAALVLRVICIGTAVNYQRSPLPSVLIHVLVKPKIVLLLLRVLSLGCLCAGLLSHSTELCAYV